MLLLLLSLSSYLQIELYKVVIVAQVVINHVNVLYHYFDQYHYFDRARSTRSSICQVRWQRQREQKHHLSTMWCVSKLEFMIISLRAKSKRNFLQNSSQLCLLRKCIFRVFWSHDQSHITCFIKRVLYVLIRFASHDIKLAKVHLRSKRNCDEFWR
jgi:hypothetical protein